MHLLEERRDGRYRFHDLVRLHARERGQVEESPEQCRAAVRRVADHYLATTTAAELLISPSHRNLARDYSQPPWCPLEFTEESAALGWLDRERDQLAAVLRDAAGRGEHSLVWQLADAMWPLFLRLRPLGLHLEAHELGLRAARLAGDRAGEQRMLTSGGQGLRSAGRPADSAHWYRQALDLAIADGDPRAESQARTGLGHAHRQLGELDSARAEFEEAMRLRTAIGYRRGVGLLRIALGEVAVDAADEAEAVRQLEAAIEDLTAVSDPYEVCRAQAIMGRAYIRAGRYDLACAALETAREGFVAAGAPPWQARTVEWLGELALTQGDLVLARERFTAAHEAYRRLAAPDVARLARRLAAIDPDPAEPNGGEAEEE
ncbi:tetratricopeptide repeat protein [Kitasatospora fiedleri]|uniref:tetratricopeptide repeat protein n=1 Tax=Kitasatospora fiedleri TaxID=2991545 RepID=UPI00249A37DF|nr:tetratricopeptide repeat protein [Kitasatospora fiedleri]